MPNPEYSGHPRIPEVLEAYKILLNDAMALDYCGITGKDRKLILNDPEFTTAARKIKAGKYIEEITEVNDIIVKLNRSSGGENARIGAEDEDPTKKLTLQLKVTSLRRELLSLSSNDKETEESESLNIFFIDVTKEEFERMQNVEVHEGSMDARLVSDASKEAPIELKNRVKKEEKKKASIPTELQVNMIEYTNEDGDIIREEVAE